MEIIQTNLSNFKKLVKAKVRVNREIKTEAISLPWEMLKIPILRNIMLILIQMLKTHFKNILFLQQLKLRLKIN